MSSFKDTKDREWIIDVDIPIAKTIKRNLKIDLMGAIDGSLFNQLASDYLLIYDLLYALCQDQADRRKIDEIEFAKALDGTAIEAGWAAVCEALVGFFPHEKRSILRDALEQRRKFESIALETASQAINDPEVEEEMRRAMTAENERLKQHLKKLGDLSTSLPESLESSPVEPSENSG